MKPQKHIEMFRDGYHMVPARGSNPNWMKLSFTEELCQKTPIVIVIDHKCEHARRALGALIQHLWISCENWTIVTTRPQ